MSKSEFIKSAWEDENNGTEESETDFTKLQSSMYEPCVSKEPVKESCSGKESSD